MISYKDINLYSHKMGVSAKGKKIPSKWSKDLDGIPQSVEHAALDFFKSKGWYASRDTFRLMDFMLMLQLISTNDLPKNIVSEILGIRSLSNWLRETRPYLLNSDEKNGWIDSDCRQKLLKIFSELQNMFSERDLVLAVMGRINGGSKNRRDYKEKIEKFIQRLKLSEDIQDALSFEVFSHYYHFEDKDFQSKEIKYHYGLANTKLDIVPMFENVSNVSDKKIRTTLLKVLPEYFESWQAHKIDELTHGYKSKPLPRKKSDVKKLPELSRKSFYNYNVHGAKTSAEVIDGLMKLYTSLSRTTWIDLAKCHCYRPEGFYHETGVPDLLIWNGREYEFVEIKSPNDRLRKSQMDYFENVLEKIPLKYSVTNVVDLNAVNKLALDKKNTWKNGLNFYSKYITETGNSKVFQNVTYEDFELGKWVKKQRALNRENKLLPEQKKALDDLCFVWEINKPMINGLEIYKRYVEETGNFQVPNLLVFDDFKLGRWVGKQRMKYSNGELLADRIRILDELGFIWNVNDFAWTNRFNSYSNYVKETGNMHVPKGFIYDGFNLSKWMSKQREAYSSRKIKPERMELLDDIGFIWHPPSSIHNS